MGTLYSSVIKDHYRHPRRYGRIQSPDAAFEDVNPLCGDRVRIELRLSDGFVADARFTGDLHHLHYRVNRRQHVRERLGKPAVRNQDG